MLCCSWYVQGEHSPWESIAESSRARDCCACFAYHFSSFDALPRPGLHQDRVSGKGLLELLIPWPS